MKVAIQGIQGSYHHQVAQELYGDTDLVECMGFGKLVREIAQGTADRGVMAIGNSIAGSILPNYGLIKEQHLSVTGEFYLNIQHQLMAAQGQNISSIDEVQSHPMALLQCGSYFQQYPHIKLVETDDTAAAARRIAASNKAGIAAVASSLAAQLYDLEIIESDIQEAKSNFTRFVILEKEVGTDEDVNKATINFTVSHKPGSLGKILTDLGAMGINLSKIQSIPVIQQPFIFSFVADLEFEHLDRFNDARSHIEKLTKSLHVLGVYKSRSL